MYESFGRWRRADYLKVHFAESWNEMHHLLIMKELGGNAWWFDRFLAQHIAIFYYFMSESVYFRKMVWKDIQQSQKGLNIQERELTFGETTLKEFFDKAGMFVDDSAVENVMVPYNASTPQNYTPQVGLSSCRPLDVLSDAPVPGRKRGPVDFEKTFERKLRRKIKNRESAARSRARKQAYHNELVSKVSHLEMENMKLKKEMEVDKLFSNHLSIAPRYQLRRTSSF